MLWSRPLGYMFSICWKNIGSSIWMKHLNKTGNIVWIEEVKSFLKNNCDTEIWEGGWTALNDALHLSTYCFFLQEYCFLLKGIPCLQGSYFEDVESFKKKVMQKMRGRLNFIKGCIASFHTLQFSCKNIVPYLGEYFFFKADCNL